MPYDLTGRSLTPLSDYISEAEFPLAEYLPLDEVAAFFSGLYVAEPYLGYEGDNFIIDCYLAFPTELSLSLPGADSYALVLGSAGPGWSAFHAILTIGPDFSLAFSDLTIGLRFDPDVLKDVQTGNPSEIEFACTLKFAPDGITISDYNGLTLDQAYICGTEIKVEANDVDLIFAGDELPQHLADQEGFQGVAFSSLNLSIPSEYLMLDPGSQLDLSITDGAIGSTGFTGAMALETDPDAQVSGQFLGFDCKFRKFSLDITENSLIAAGLLVDVRLEALEDNSSEKWVSLDVAFDQGGSFSARAAALQPPEASSDANALVTLDYPGAVKFSLQALRLSKEVTDNVDLWAFYFSGDLEILAPGATWPDIGFDEIGVRSDGHLLLPEGGGITFETPLVVEWYFVRLTVPKFRFGRPQGSQNKLQIQLAAEVNLLEGLPAGASVEGLSITWDPNSNASPEITMEGIGIEFGVPGCFSAGIKVGYIQDGGSVDFRGQGHLELNALDMGIQIGVVIGYDEPQDFAYLYLFADAKLLPTGIPIGQSGLSIYGFQGLIASNMALALNQNLPVDERYYTLFTAPPIGITDIAKWGKNKGQNALGIGIVLGTADKGFAFNVKGLFAVAFPDLVLLLQAKANFIKLKPDLSTASEGTLDALMVFDSIQNTFTFDIVARWGMPSILEVSGSARAFFDFSDPGAFYLRIGQDFPDKRVSANVVKWGNGWLFSAGFWFELNMDGVVTGVLIEVGERYSSGGFWIEAIGSARGEMALFWDPAQWEGSIALAGRIGAGYRGISIGLSLSGSAEVNVARPLGVELSARACFRALFWKICKSHTFKWEKLDPPKLSHPLKNIAAKPVDWTLLVEDAPSFSGPAGEAKAFTGIVQLVKNNTAGKLQPHSEISIDFAKPMIDDTVKFNEVAGLPDQGFMTIGDRSDYSASFELLSISLVRDPDGEAENIKVWGIWALETPHYNTTLRLWSSTRFGHDGSLSESFVSGIDLDYCGQPDDRTICLSLAGLTPGWGWLDGRFRYHWDTSNSEQPFIDRRNSPFIELLQGDQLSVFLPGSASNVTFKGKRCPKRPDRPKEKDTPDDKDGSPIITGNWFKVLLDRLFSTIRKILRRLFAAFVGSDTVIGNDTTGTTTGTLPDKPARKTIPAKTTKEGGSEITPESQICLDQICYMPGHSSPEYVSGTRRGGLQTSSEIWTIPAEARLLVPGDKYRLSVEVKSRLKEPSGTITEQSNAQNPWITDFVVDTPPHYHLALKDYVSATYPADGARPIYTGYDIMIRFVADYVPYLYTVARQQLLIRLFDGQGIPVVDANGDPVLLPATRIGMPERSLAESYWERQYLINQDKGCIQEDLGDRTSETIISVEGPSITLTPNSQYRAELVSDADVNVPLYLWTFTTSAFSTFQHMVTQNRQNLSPRLVMGSAGGNNFETAARNLDIDTIAYVDHFTVTPIVSLDRSQCRAFLMEAPEPLDTSSRLAIRIDGNPIDNLANQDETRLILRRPNGGTWVTGSHLVQLVWSRGLSSERAENQRSVAGILGDEIVEFTCESGGA